MSCTSINPLIAAITCDTSFQKNISKYHPLQILALGNH